MFSLREASPEDARAVLGIYAPYIKNTVITFEYEIPSPASFRERMEDICGKYPYLICEEDGIAVGYAYAHRYMERAAYGWDAELSVYLDESHVGQGIGRALYTALIELLKCQNLKNVYGIVTSPNEASEALHRSLGFRLRGISAKTGYKHGEWRDVAWYEKAIGSFEREPEPLIAFSQVDKVKVNRILKEAEGMIRQA